MKLVLKPILLAVLLIVFSHANAQKQWSLTDCIEYAHQNNLQVKQASFRADIAKNNYFQSKMSILPDLNASYSRSLSFGRKEDPATNVITNDNVTGDQYYVGSELTLFAGLRNYNNIKANEFNSLSKIQNVEKEKINISLQIASAYLAILFNQELLDIANNQKGITALQVDRTTKLVEAGSAAKGDLLEIKAQLASEDLNVTNAQNALNLSYLNLSQLLELESTEGFDIVRLDSLKLTLSQEIDAVNTVYNEALEFLPHIKSAEYDLRYTERNLKIQKGGLYPTIGVGANWQTRFSNKYRNPLTQELYSYGDQLNLSKSTTLGMSVRIPLFNRWQTMNNISNAKIGVYQSETALEQTKNQLYKEIQQAYNDALSASEKFESATVAVESYQEAFSYTEQKFSVGIVNSVEYNIAKNNYIKSESDLLQAKYAYLFAIKILDFYKGIPLSL